MTLEYHHVDAFTDSRFKGNYAGVIITDDWLADSLMQSIATENNLSETAFVVLNNGIYHIRWFSPLAEIDFCGHATLASAFVLFKKNADFAEITFYAKAVGQLKVCRAEDDYIAMTFPRRAPIKVDEIPSALINGLSIEPAEVWQSQQAYFAIYESEQAVHDVVQNVELIKQLAPHDVVVTAPAKGSEYDFASRYFWPANGGDEDPVTGSIHAGLVPFWAQRLGKNELVALQASARGGILKCRVIDDQIEVAGRAVQYMTGVIEI
jgi:PhzF family phenazine biosynthesis protein